MSAGKLVDGRTLWLAAAVAMLVAAFFVHKAGPTSAVAADHLDNPGLTPPPNGDGIGTDLTDIYAFRSPADASKTVLILNVNGLLPGDLASPPGADRAFATKVPNVQGNPNVSYNFRVDSNGDAVSDRTIRIRFNNPDGNGSQHMRVDVLDGSGNELLDFAGSSTGFGQSAVVNNGPSGIKYFAGRRDDPFFFDLFGFINILHAIDSDPNNNADSFVGCTTPRADTFLKQNVSSIVLELPSSMLEGGGDSNIGVWATTNVGDQQIDRMGRPAINTVFIPNNPIPPDNAGPSKKATFNHGDPSTDVATWKPEVVNTLATLFSLNDPASNLGGTDDPSDDAATVNGLANFLLPDILTVDVSSTAGFPNGRKLADDVIDTELNLITEGFVPTDCVGNDSTFLGTFPYVGAPNHH